jgi:hypothetical protein
MCGEFIAKYLRAAMLLPGKDDIPCGPFHILRSQTGERPKSHTSSAHSAAARVQSPQVAYLRKVAGQDNRIARRKPPFRREMQTLRYACVLDSAIWMRRWHRPEMAHLFAWNIHCVRRIV